MNEDNPLINLIYQNEDNLLAEFKRLLDAGADPNEKTKYAETPLRVASIKGHFDIVKLLFEYGANPEQLNWSPLFHAIAFGTSEDVKEKTALGETLDSKDTWDRTPFLLAVQVGDTNIVDILLEAGADLFDEWRSDKSALEIAIQSDDHQMLKFLIQKGLNPERYNSFGYTPLIQACEDNAINCAKTLVDLGVDIFKKNVS